MESSRATLRRRDLLAAAAASLALGSDGRALAREPLPSESTRHKEVSMNSRPLMTLRLTTAPTQKLGSGPHGIRVTFPITDGEFEGPRLRGRVLSGGDDWTVLRADGVLEADLRITLRTDDDALVHMTFQGLRHDGPEAKAALGRGELPAPESYYFRTFPRFETAAPRYAFLNQLLAVGTGEIRPTGPVHIIEEIL
jgi:hypothetical protein